MGYPFGRPMPLQNSPGSLYRRWRLSPEILTISSAERVKSKTWRFSWWARGEEGGEEEGGEGGVVRRRGHDGVKRKSNTGVEKNGDIGVKRKSNTEGKRNSNIGVKRKSNKGGKRKSSTGVKRHSNIGGKRKSNKGVERQGSKKRVGWRFSNSETVSVSTRKEGGRQGTPFCMHL